MAVLNWRVWRIEAKCDPFHGWMTVDFAATLDQAIHLEKRYSGPHHHYRTRIRANV